MNSNEIRDLLRQHGLRATPQKMAIAKHLLTENCHCTPQELFEELKTRFPSMSPNTVYLTLGQLEERGILERIHVGRMTVYDSNTSEHDHAFCTQCGLIMDIEHPKPNASPTALNNWNIKGERSIWYGMCDNCCKEESALPQ